MLISTADYVSAYGNDKDMRILEGTCTVCHNFSRIMRRRGMTAEEWSSFLQNMGNKFVTPKFSQEQLNELSPILEKFFGPDSLDPTKEQVQHPSMSDEALHATFRMYKPPTTNLAHSANVAPNGQIWFTEFDNFSNKIASFDSVTQEFREFEMPAPKSGAHNPWVARNGMVWVTENGVHKLAVLDPETGKITEYTPPPGAGTHTLKEDSQGNIWTSGGKITKFDPNTKKFTVYDATSATYDLGLDSGDNAWGATRIESSDRAGLFRVDSKTGNVKLFPVSDLKSTRGVAVKGIDVDSQDNVWFGDVLNHRLGKFNQKTEKITYYRPPTSNFGPYGVLVDKKTGYIWVADYEGSGIDRFDPVTEKFVEYPFPSRITMIRFFGEDSGGRIWFTDFATGRIGLLETGATKMAAQE